MELLEAAMAFAIVMIIFSTIATGIVEFVLRLWGLRGKCLRRAVDELFDEVVWPRLQDRLIAISGGAVSARDNAKTDFSNGLLDNPAKSPRLISLFTGDRRISVLTTLAFAERLGRTDVGKAILDEGEVQLDLLVNDFVRTYNRFSRAASEVYRRNAQMIAIAVGILLAIGANIDASRLVATLIEDPDLRSDLIQSADDVVSQNQAALDGLREAGAALSTDSEDDSALDKVKDAIAALEKNKAEFNDLSEGRLPVGLGYFPHCYLPTGAVEQQPSAEAAGMRQLQSIKDWSECRAKRPEYVSLWGYLRDLWGELPRPLFFQWLGMTILAGVLIGLGGPFWYHVFTSLSQLFQLLKAIGLGGTSRPEATPEQITPSESAEDSAKPKNIIDAFKIAAQVHAQSIDRRP